MERLSEDTPQDAPKNAPQVERLDFLSHLRDLEPVPGTYLPKTVVQAQRWLAGKTDAELTRLLAETAIALAARSVDGTPEGALIEASKRVKFRDWFKVKMEVRKVTQRGFGEAASTNAGG